MRRKFSGASVKGKTHMLHRELQTILRFLENCSSNNSCWRRHIAARTSAKETQRRQRRDLRDRCHGEDEKVRDAAWNWDSHSWETERKKENSKKHESVVVGPTKHTAHPALHRHTHTAKCKRRPSSPAGPMGLFGISLGIRDVLLALGTCFWLLGFYSNFKCKHYFLNFYLYKMINFKIVIWNLKVSVFCEILHPGNTNKKALMTSTMDFSGKKWHNLTTLWGIFVYKYIVISLSGLTILSYIISSYQNKFKFEFYFELDGNVSFFKCVVSKCFFFPMMTNDEKNLNIFYINLHPFCFSYWIWIPFNSI